MISHKLESWDGESVDYLDQLDVKAEDLYYLSNHLNVASSYLLKKYSKKFSYTTEISKKIIENILVTKDWTALLNNLQTLPALEIDPMLYDELYNKLLILITDSNLFIKAWSYNGLYVLSKVYERIRVDVLKKLDYALISEAPSVKARIRKIVRDYEKSKNNI